MAYSYLRKDKQNEFMELSKKIEYELQGGLDAIISSRKSPPETWNLVVFINSIKRNMENFAVEAHILQSSKYR